MFNGRQTERSLEKRATFFGLGMKMESERATHFSSSPTPAPSQPPKPHQGRSHRRRSHRHSAASPAYHRSSPAPGKDGQRRGKLVGQRSPQCSSSIRSQFLCQFNDLFEIAQTYAGWHGVVGGENVPSRFLQNRHNSFHLFSDGL